VNAAAASACLVFAVVSFTTRPVGAANLCSSLVLPLTEGTDDRRTTEANFDAEALSEAL
jgi:hypothetical protein